MEKAELEDGKRRVQEHLIGPMEGLQMVRKRGVTVADHDAAMEKLRGVLAYMAEENLIALREVVLPMAGGKAKNEWPAVATVLNYAKSIQVPPPSDSPMIVSFMKSAAGQRALDGGYLVELYTQLKTGVVPRGDYAYKLIKEKAAENASLAELIRERRGRGSARQSDLAWLDGYERTRERAVALVPQAEVVE